MTKACILVKSPREATYSGIVEQIRSKFGVIESVDLVFYQTDRLHDILWEALIGEGVEINVRDVTKAKDLIPILKNVDLCDVTALPKEDLIEVVAVILGRKKPLVFTRTKDEKNPYIDLLSSDAISKFTRGYFIQVWIVRAIISVTLCAIGALVILQMIELIPNSPLWATWIGITIGLLGIVLSWRSFKYA